MKTKKQPTPVRRVFVYERGKGVVEKPPEQVEVGSSSFVGGFVAGGRSTCESLSVIPQQREEAIQDALSKGLSGFDFDAEGTLTFESKRARREFLLAYDHNDKNPGFAGSVYKDQRIRYRENRREA